MQNNIPIYIVSLENSERNKILKEYYSSEEFKNTNIFINDTKSGKDLNYKNLCEEGFYNIDSFMSYKIYDYKTNKLFPGTFGCSYGHMILYKKMIDEDINECIIMEDNVVLAKDYLDEWCDLLNNLKTNNIDYDIIHLHSFRKIDTQRKNIIDNIYYGNNECGGTKMYYLNKKTAQILFINNFPITSPSDGISCIPSRNSDYNLKTLYYCFKKMSFIKTQSIRALIDNESDNNKKLILDENNIINYSHLSLILNDKKMVYKLNNNFITKKFIYKLNHQLMYKIKPIHYDYNLNCINKEKLSQILIHEINILNNKNESVGININANIIFNLLENKEYDELSEFIRTNGCMDFLSKEKLLSIITRIKTANYDKQFISTMIKCSNYTIGWDFEDNNKEYKSLKHEFGKLYVKLLDNDTNIFLHFSFDDNNTELNCSVNYFEIGDIVLNNSFCNNEIIEYYSESIIENIILTSEE
jgi:glycosyl transferase family 25